jgi:hypothetical protein
MRFIGGRIVSLSCGMETGGKLNFKPTMVFRYTEGTSLTDPSTIDAVRAKEAFFTSAEMTAQVSSTDYDIRSVNFDFMNGFFGDGQDDHALGDRYRKGVSWNEDMQVTGGLTFREPQAAMAVAQRAHTAMNFTMVATANVKFTSCTTWYPMIKIHFPTIYVSENNDRFNGYGRVAHDLQFYSEQDSDGADNFAKAPIQVEINHFTSS